MRPDHRKGNEYRIVREVLALPSELLYSTHRSACNSYFYLTSAPCRIPTGRVVITIETIPRFRALPQWRWGTIISYKPGLGTKAASPSHFERELPGVFDWICSLEKCTYYFLTTTGHLCTTMCLERFCLTDEPVELWNANSEVRGLDE